MMKYLLLILLFMPATGKAQSKAQYNQNNAVQEAEAMEQFRAAWFRFADAVLTKDMALIKKLSAACIHCSGCAEKTKGLNDGAPSVEDRLVPIDHFLSDHLPSVFNAATQARMKNPGKLLFVDDSHNRDLYQAPCMGRTDSLSRQKEVLLLFIDAPKEEGFSQIFSFMETQEGYKFCGYSTVR